MVLSLFAVTCKSLVVIPSCSDGKKEELLWKVVKNDLMWQQ